VNTTVTPPLVSLIVPAYNSAAFIQEAIESVRAQSYPYWELIIVDDCSTDDTYKLAANVAKFDHRVKVFRNEQNLGTAGNRKAAFMRSTGEFIAHFDSDDILERYAIEETLRAFAMRPTVSLIYSDLADIDINGQLVGYRNHPPFDPNRLYEHGWRPFGMYRRTVMDKIAGYNDKLPSCEDGDLFMQIAEHFEIYKLPKVLYQYRAHGNNTSSKNKQCSECPARPICNYIRVWAKSANYDPITFTPLGS